MTACTRPVLGAAWLLCLWPALAGAQTDAPVQAVSDGGAASEPGLSEFAFSIPLEPETDTAVHVALLPDAVYRGVAHADLSDVRVFNAAGEPVPHAIRLATSRPSPTASELRAVPLFPLSDPEQQPDTAGAMTLRIERDGNGSVIDLRQVEPTTPAATAKVPTAYLLDLRALERPVAALTLTLAETDDDYVVPIELDASDDLVRFRRGVAQHTLVSLHYDGHVVERRQVPLAGLQAPFLRLRAGGDGLPASLLSARVTLVARDAPPPRVELRALGVARANQPGTYDFDLGGGVPAETIGLALPHDNTLVEATLSVRASAQAKPERVIHAGTFYRVRHAGAVLASEPVPIPRTSERYWVLRVDPKGGGLGAGKPELVLSRTPDQLLFLARGAAPFQLAYGHHAAFARGFSPAQLLRVLPARKLSDLPEQDTRLGAPVERAGPSALRAPPPPPPYRTYALWAVLILGVVLLAAAARAVLRSQAG